MPDNDYLFLNIFVRRFSGHHPSMQTVYSIVTVLEYPPYFPELKHNILLLKIQHFSLRMRRNQTGIQLETWSVQFSLFFFLFLHFVHSGQKPLVRYVIHIHRSCGDSKMWAHFHLLWWSESWRLLKLLTSIVACCKSQFSIWLLDSSDIKIASFNPDRCSGYENILLLLLLQLWGHLGSGSLQHIWFRAVSVPRQQNTKDLLSQSDKVIVWIIFCIT